MMKNRQWVWVVSALVVLVLGTWGISPAAAPDKIKIGLMFGMTGPASPIGPVQLKGAQMAIKEANDRGRRHSGREKDPGRGGNQGRRDQAGCGAPPFPRNGSRGQGPRSGRFDFCPPGRGP